MAKKNAPPGGKFGKSTRNAQNAFRARKPSKNLGNTIDAKNPGGGPAPGNEGIARGEFDMPRALQPPVGGAAPTAPPITGDVPTAQPPDFAQPPAVGAEMTESAPDAADAPTSIASAVSDFVSGAPASAPPMDSPAAQEPGDPAGSYRTFEGAEPQTGPTTGAVQEIAGLERDPALDLMLRRYKGGAG